MRPRACTCVRGGRGQLRRQLDPWRCLCARADPFRDDEAANEEGINSKNYIHVRVQQRNGRKSLTTVQGLDAQLSYKKVLKAFKKAFCCNGTVVDDQELGQVRYPLLFSGALPAARARDAREKCSVVADDRAPLSLFLSGDPAPG